MIRKSTTTGFLTLAALLVLGAFSAGSASAQQFLWTGPLPGLLLVLSDNPQFFSAGGLAVICEHFGGHGILSNGKAMTVKDATITGLYTKCIAAGAFPAEVSPAEFLVDANGTISVVGRPIVITIPAAGCSLKLNNSGANNSNLKTIKFLNQKEDVLAHVEINNILALPSAEPCGAPGAEITSEYRGLLLVKVDGGILRWIS